MQLDGSCRETTGLGQAREGRARAGAGLAQGGQWEGRPGPGAILIAAPRMSGSPVSFVLFFLFLFLFYLFELPLLACLALCCSPPKA